MQNEFYPCGYIVQSDQTDPVVTDCDENYNGIGRYLVWPLDAIQNDPLADAFWEEASHSWFNYADTRVCSVPDINYITRYIQYCERVNIKTRVLYLRCLTDYEIDFQPKGFRNYRWLGYDYAEGDLSFSQLFDDLFCTDLDELTPLFAPHRDALNDNGLFSSIPEAQAYIQMRLELAPRYNLEDSTCAEILEVSIVKDFEDPFLIDTASASCLE